MPSFVDPSKRNITVIRQQFFDESPERAARKSRLIHRLNDNGDVILALDIAKNESKFSLLVRMIILFSLTQLIRLKLWNEINLR